MAKILYLCFRDGRDDRRSVLRNRIPKILRDICPDNISADPTIVTSPDGILAAVLNQTRSVTRVGTSFRLGDTLGSGNWHEPGAAPPDGNYAIIKSDHRRVEIVADAVASRAIWYYMDDSLFVASSSQRAIVQVLGTFQFNDAAIPWMLTTGTLGPANSWDCRVSRIMPAESLTVDRDTWRVTSSRSGGDGQCKPIEGKDCVRQLQRSIEAVFRHSEMDYSDWVLPLSGGVDSRALLMLMKDRTGLKTVTWGTAGSHNNSASDAAVAKQVAEVFGIPNRYFETDSSTEALDVRLDRFLVAGDGCCDHIAGYMDGFAVWKTLHDRSIGGIVRGDEGFGWKNVRTECDVRQSVGIPLWQDFGNLPPAEQLSLSAPRLPDDLERGAAESLEHWRDRLYHSFRIPVVLSALSDLKLPYLEISSPFLSRSIIDCVRRMSDEFRTEKRAFRAFVESISPQIPYATDVSIENRSAILRQREFTQLLMNVLRSQTAQSLFDPLFLDYVSRCVASTENKVSRLAQLRGKSLRVWPALLSRLRIDGAGRFRLDLNLLAFRVYLICRMHEILSREVTGFRSGQQGQSTP